jgi:hydrogenase maturation protein HypF
VASAAGEYNIAHVALGGGCFHNEILRRTLSDRLAAQGLYVLSSAQPNDSAISLGQAWVAVQSIKKEFEKCV